MKILLLSLLLFYADGSIKPPNLPTFSEEPQDTWFKENLTAFLTCSVNSHSEMFSYQWMFESNVVSEYNNLTRIQVSKYGAYRCLVSNWFGTITSRTAQVKKPILRLLCVKDVQKIISEGESLFLPSAKIIESIPPVANVFWEKKTRTDEWDVVVKDKHTKNGSLLILGASKEAEDDTEYRFKIQQNNGDSVIDCNIQVKIAGELSNSSCENSSVVFMEVPKNISVYAGEPISIECLAILRRCKFPPSVRWYHNSVKILTHKTLIIAKSNLSDTGNYICVVQAQENKNEAETLVLVTEKPKIKSNTPEFLTVSFKDGSSITLDGSILTSTDGLKKVDWYSNGKLISRNLKYSITTDNKLVINQPNVSDSGIYQVFYFFDGFELKDAFNAVFLYELENSSVVSDVFTSISSYSIVSISSHFKSPVSIVKSLTPLNIESSISHSPFVSPATSFFYRTLSTETFSSKYLPFDPTSSFSFLMTSSFSPSLIPFVFSSISASSQSTVIVKKDKINNVTLIITLSAVSVVSVILLLIGLLIRKRCSQKKATSVQVSEELVTRAEKKLDSSSEDDGNNYALPEYRPTGTLKEQGTSNQRYVVPNTSNLKLKCESHENPYWSDEPDYKEIEMENAFNSSTESNEPNDSYMHFEPSNLFTVENGFSDHDSNIAKKNEDIEPDYKELEVSALNLPNLSSNYASICGGLTHELYEPLVEGGSRKSPKYEAKRPFIKDSYAFLSRDSSTSKLSNIYTPLNTQQLQGCTSVESNKTENYYSDLNSPKPSLNNSKAFSQPYASLNFSVPSNAPNKLRKNVVRKK